MHYHRKDLAEKFSAVILGGGVVSTTSLLIAAPRRTGKSTFMTHDLAPLLKERDALVIYVDLWENKDEDPSKIIAKAILQQLKKNSVRSKMVEGISGLEISIAGVSLSATKEKVEDLTFADALEVLSQKTEKKIVLIIDEFQHALSTKEGDNAVFALKAARDRLNRPENHGLVILGTGSNQDKLARLRNSKDQAFYLTPLQTLPYLGKDFTHWLTGLSGLKMDPDVVWEMFQEAGNKPEIVKAAIENLRLDFSLTVDLTERFRNDMLDSLRNQKDVLERKIQELPVSQWAVLALMCQTDGLVGLQSREAVNRCQALAKYKDADIRLDSSSIQAALAALKKKKFIWLEKRGTYHVEEDIVKDIVLAPLRSSQKNSFPKIS